VQRKFNKGDSVRIKKNTKGYICESGFVYIKHESQKFTLTQEIPDEIINYFSPKLWVAVGEGVFLYIEESFLVNSKIILTEKTETMD